MIAVSESTIYVQKNGHHRQVESVSYLLVAGVPVAARVCCPRSGPKVGTTLINTIITVASPAAFCQLIREMALTALRGSILIGN